MLLVGIGPLPTWKSRRAIDSVKKQSSTRSAEGISDGQLTIGATGAERPLIASPSSELTKGHIESVRILGRGHWLTRPPRRGSARRSSPFVPQPASASPKGREEAVFPPGRGHTAVASALFFDIGHRTAIPRGSDLRENRSVRFHNRKEPGWHDRQPGS